MVQWPKFSIWEEGVGFWIRVVSSDHLLKELEALKYMCTLSHHIWTLAWALTDKSEWRLTAVTCRSITTHLGERSAASRAGETSQPQIHMNAHYGCWCKNVYSVLVAVMKAPSEPETETPRWCHLGKKNPSSFPLVVGAERVREKGWGALLVHHALAFSDNSLPGKFHAERSSDNTRRSSGGTLFLHQWAKVGQKKKKKSTLVSSGYITSDWLFELQAVSSMTEYRTVWFLSMLEVYCTEIPVESQRS